MASDEAFLHELDGFLDSNLLEFPPVDLLPLDILPVDTVSIDEDVGQTAFHEESSRNDDKEQQNVEKLERLRDRETKRRRVYRQRLKDERDELRLEVENLVMTLTRLKQNVLRRKAVNRQAASLSTDCGADAWKTVALWELESLRRSRAEQKRLHSVIDVQTKLMKDLRKLVFKRIASKALASAALSSKFHRIQSPDAALYGVYLRELDANYTQINEVFRACGVHTMAEGAMNWTVTNQANNSVRQLLHARKRLHSFDFERMCESFWRLANLKHRCHDRTVFEGVEDPNNTFAVKYRISKVLRTGAIDSIQQRLVQRRFCETDSMVIVWKIFVEGERHFEGMHSVETGWCRLKPATSQAGTWLEMHVRRSPMHYAAALRLPFLVKQFNEILEETIHEDQQQIFQELNRLMNEENF